MKPHVLLAGGTGYIGKSLIKELRDTTTLHTISQYPKSQSHADTTVIKGDIYHYADVLRAMEGMDIAVYFRSDEAFSQIDPCLSERFKFNRSR